MTRPGNYVSSSFDKLWEEWLQPVYAKISRLICMNNESNDWLTVAFGYHQPIISNACPPKWSQKSLWQKLVPIPHPFLRSVGQVEPSLILIFLTCSCHPPQTSAVPQCSWQSLGNFECKLMARDFLKQIKRKD